MAKQYKNNPNTDYPSKQIEHSFPFAPEKEIELKIWEICPDYTNIGECNPGFLGL